ncbi:39S ribosomal protein L52, mitochondrial-like [Uloborus diversus]|uniref:39S ribosomal protein L52, mitochondrial-like n=1 Tax=Uloborus diversus TaxID=327109 RepID=UPI00240A81B5|nr:39S ribosomal protein L52, mitochondrial-like [Uloborus diversus]
MFPSIIHTGIKVLGSTIQVYNSSVRLIHTAPILYRIGGWRLRQGLPAKGVEYGPMTDLPDWSYADGRPAPLSHGQRKRIKLQKQYCEQIIQLTKEVDECFELQKEKTAKENEKREAFLRNRLKPKGDALRK